MISSENSRCNHLASSPGNSMADGGLLLCEQPEVHAEAAALRAEVLRLQMQLDSADNAVFRLEDASPPEPANTLARRWWAQASPAERLRLQDWALAVPGPLAECTMEWAHGGRKVLAVRCAVHAAAGRTVYLRDMTHSHDVDRMKSDFLSAAAHELRTPLASIYGFAELMLVRTLAPEKQRELVGTIHRQAQSLIDLINELLDISRIEAQQGKDLHIVPCALAALVQGTLDGLHYKADRHTLHCDLRHGQYTVLADADKTRQALLNVLSNAVKYSPQGGNITLSTTLRGVGGQQQVGLQVQDEGMGMDSEQCHRAFERFYRAHPLGDIPGTGLGLSLVQEIMQLQSGEVELESVQGQGTKVTLWLPTQEPADGPVQGILPTHVH